MHRRLLILSRVTLLAAGCSGGCGTHRVQAANHHPQTATVSVTVDVAVPICPYHDAIVVPDEEIPDD